MSVEIVGFGIYVDTSSTFGATAIGCAAMRSLPRRSIPPPVEDVGNLSAPVEPCHEGRRVFGLARFGRSAPYTGQTENPDIFNGQNPDIFDGH